MPAALGIVKSNSNHKRVHNMANAQYQLHVLHTTQYYTNMHKFNKYTCIFNELENKQKLYY